MNFSFDGYKILLEQKLQKSIKNNLPQQLKEVFESKLKYLSKNPSYPSLNTKRYGVSKKILIKLGVSEVWEFYINGKEYRCIFYVSHGEKIIIIAYVGNHQQIKNKYC
ncbi:MAG: hypothetical protein C3F02_04410 [Parcubacteria group bacterium]|nr:MAG: hypothetical protein C3F02_04410 [Parcubacteria group bacterium]